MDRITKEKRHYNMSRIRGKDTTPELKVRGRLFADKFRYRLNVRSLPGTPDIVLPKYRTCIFVNGCFWHGHKGCKYYTVPKTNSEFWIQKIRKNQERDIISITRLESLNWSVITIWECELKPKSLDDTMSKIESELQTNKIKWENYLIRRKTDIEFAKAESERIKSVRALVEKELDEQFYIPKKIRRMSHKETEI